MKVALFCTGMPVVSQTFVMRHVCGLLEAGVDLTVFAREPSTDSWDHVPERWREEIRTRTQLLDPGLFSSWKRLLRRAPSSATARSELLRLAKVKLGRQQPELGRFDAMLAHFGPIGADALLLRDKGYVAGPLATIFHGYEMSMHQVVETLQPTYRRLFARSEALLPISHYWGKRLESWGADPAKIRVLRMGVDLPESVDAGRGALGRPLRVMSVGRFVEKKGMRYAIEGVRQCSEPVRLEIIGFGPLDEELRTLAEETPGTNEIVFRGSLRHPEVLAALRAADVFLLPSVTAENGDMEGIPVAIMEAMIHGCVVLTTIHSGIPELVRDGVSGLLVPERSSADIAEALAAIVQGKHDLEALRRNAVEIVSRAFNNDKLDARLLAILQSMAQGRALPPDDNAG